MLYYSGLYYDCVFMLYIGVGTGGQGWGALAPPISKDIVLVSYIDYY